MRTKKFFLYSAKAAVGSDAAAAADMIIVAMVLFFMAILYFKSFRVWKKELHN